MKRLLNLRVLRNDLFKVGFDLAKDSSNFPGPGNYEINSVTKLNFKKKNSRHNKNVSFTSNKELARSCFKDLIKNSCILLFRCAWSW